MTFAHQGGEAPDDWCDRCHRFVEPGSTRPFEPGSSFRMCADCVAESAAAAAEWQRLRDAGADETRLRAAAGDR